MIKLFNDDLFAGYADLYVVSRSTTATMTAPMKNGLSSLGVQLNERLEYRELGSVDYIQVNSSTRNEFEVGFATAVDNDYSKFEYIEEIVQNIAKHCRNNSKIRTVALPLLGTGAGRLDPVDVYKLYKRILEAQPPFFMVYTLEETIFSNIVRGVNSDKERNTIENSDEEDLKPASQTTNQSKETRSWCLVLDEPGIFNVSNEIVRVESDFCRGIDNPQNEIGSILREGESIWVVVSTSRTVLRSMVLIRNRVIDSVHLLVFEDNREYFRSFNLTHEVDFDYIPKRIFEYEGKCLVKLSEYEDAQIRDYAQQEQVGFASDASNINIRDNGIESVLGVKEMARDFSEVLIRIPNNEKGAMVGVFGRWGRGKSRFISELWEVLEKKSDENKRVDFLTWKYQDTPATWAYLYEQFSISYFEDSKVFAKSGSHSALKKIGIRICDSINLVYRRIKLNVIRKGRLRFWIDFIPFLAALFWATLSFTTKIELMTSLLSKYTSVVFSVFFLYLKIRSIAKFKGRARDLFNEYYSKTSFSSLLGAQNEIEKELVFLVRAWNENIWGKVKAQKRIFLFVEDIDRCDEKNIIKIIDSLRVMLENQELSESIMVVAAIDQRILKTALSDKYRYLLQNTTRVSKEEGSWEKNNFDDLQNEYFDKLFLFGINLGQLGAKDRLDILNSIIKADLAIDLNQADGARGPHQSQKIVESDEEPEINLNENNFNASNGQTNNVKNTTVETKSFAVNASEKKMLQRLMQESEFLTPRQIRVFYYRYHFVKKLALASYVNGAAFKSLDNNSCSFIAQYLLAVAKGGGISVRFNELLNNKIEPTGAGRIQENQSDGISDEFEGLYNLIVLSEQRESILRALDLAVAY